MTLVSLLLALILEQVKPFRAARFLYPVLESMGRFFEDHFDDGQARHGIVAWCLLVLPPTLFEALAYFFILYTLHWSIALLFNVMVLYCTMGFRHSSHFFTRIHSCLRAQDLEQARSLLSQWRGRPQDLSSTNEVVRLTIEEGIVGAHRQVFAVLLWFIVLPGPSGAVLYRMADYYAKRWAIQNSEPDSEFSSFATQVFSVIEWVPARLTGIAFSFMGDFEKATYCWRFQSAQWPDRNEGSLLAAGAGALGVCIGQPIVEGGALIERPELGVGDEADVEHLQSFVLLVRRVLVLEVIILLALQGSRILG